MPLAVENAPESGAINNAIEDFDHDGFPNHLDGDSEGDSLSDALERGVVTTPVDTDEDDDGDFRDLDSDGDGLADRLRLSFSLPVALVQGDDPPNLLDGVDVSPSETVGIGDLSAAADVRVWSSKEVTLAAGAVVALPTGKSTAYFGDERASYFGRVQAAGDHQALAWAVSAGVASREGRIARTPFENEVRFAASIGPWLFQRTLLIGPELHGVAPFGASDGQRNVALEADLGAHYRVHHDWLISAGVGPGLSRSPGVPDFRALFAVDFAPAYEPAPVVAYEPPPAPGRRPACPSSRAGARGGGGCSRTATSTATASTCTGTGAGEGDPRRRPHRDQGAGAVRHRACHHQGRVVRAPRWCRAHPQRQSPDQARRDRRSHG
jgi:hypothetical protein